MTGPVILHIAPSGVATLTLNRAESANRYDGTMLAMLHKALGSVSADPALRCLVLRGAGRHFCAGADLNAEKAGSLFIDVVLALDRFAKPAIAMVQGGCIGGGVALAACCDIVLAARQAFFAIPEVRLGLAPGPLLPVFQRAIGARAVRRYALTGERFTAETAQRIGLVSELFDDDGAATLAPLVDHLCHGAPDAMRATKQLAATIARPRLDAAQMRALDSDFLRSLESPEAQEGLAAFRSGRPPSWFTEARSLQEGVVHDP